MCQELYTCLFKTIIVAISVHFLWPCEICINVYQYWQPSVLNVNWCEVTFRAKVFVCINERSDSTILNHVSREREYWQLPNSVTPQHHGKSFWMSSRQDSLDHYYMHRTNLSLVIFDCIISFYDLWLWSKINITTKRHLKKCNWR